MQPLHRTNAQAHNHCGIHATPRRFSPRNENQPSVTFADQQKLCSPAAAQQEAERKLKGRKKMDWKYKLFDSAKLDWGRRGKKTQISERLISTTSSAALGCGTAGLQEAAVNTWDPTATLWYSKTDFAVVSLIWCSLAADSQSTCDNQPGIVHWDQKSTLTVSRPKQRPLPSYLHPSTINLPSILYNPTSTHPRFHPLPS